VDVPASLPSWVGQLWVQARLGHGKGGARAGTLVAFCLLLQRQARAMLREPLRWFVPKLLICLAFGCFLGSMYDHPVITNFTPKGGCAAAAPQRSLHRYCVTSCTRTSALTCCCFLADAPLIRPCYCSVTGILHLCDPDVVRGLRDPSVHRDDKAQPRPH